MGQVTHALLTRPPLSRKPFLPEGILGKRFVRLACVKHAASVHPEPGSNSHVDILSLNEVFHEFSEKIVPCNLMRTSSFLRSSNLVQWNLLVLFDSIQASSLAKYPTSFDVYCF